jgi:hypothetical protein
LTNEIQIDTRKGVKSINFDKHFNRVGQKNGTKWKLKLEVKALMAVVLLD